MKDSTLPPDGLPPRKPMDEARKEETFHPASVILEIWSFPYRNSAQTLDSPCTRVKLLEHPQFSPHPISHW